MAQKCNACSGSLGKTDNPSVFECRQCGGLHAFGIYLGDSYSLVLPVFEMGEYNEDETRYFDFTTLGSKGIERRHGWFLPRTKKIVQVG